MNTRTAAAAESPRAVRLLLRLLVALHLSVALGFVLLWLLAAREGLLWRSDFSAYYTGWALLRDGHGAHLYNLAWQTRYQQQILTEGQFAGGLLPYVNPPHATLPFVPLALLPRSEAFWLWSAGQVALLLLLLRALLRVARGWSALEHWLLVSSTLAFLPLFFTFVRGTFSLWMALCAAHWYLALKHDQPARAGMWLTLGTVKPQLLLLPGFATLAARRWRALAAGGALLALLVALSLVAPGWQSWRGFVRILAFVSAQFDTYGIVLADMYNLKGTLALLLGKERHALVNALGSAALLASVAGTLLLWRGAWQPTSPRFELKMALTLLAGLLFNLHLFQHDGLMLVVPALLAYAAVREHGSAGARTPLAAFLLSCPLLFLIGEFGMGTLLRVRVPVLAMLVLLVWLMALLWQTRPAGRQ